jgi:hypothetical protein
VAYLLFASVSTTAISVLHSLSICYFQVFMNACKKAKPEPIKDPVYENTFRAAFSATKAAYGYFGMSFIFGTECEMLEHLTNQILSREILDDLILERAKSQPATNAKNTALEVHRQVQKIVKPIIAHAWDNCFAAVRVLKAPFELSVKASMKQLLQKEGEVKSLLEPKIREIVLPHLSEIDNTICAPVLEGCFEPMLQAYEQAVEGLQVELCMLVHTVEPTVEAVAAAQAALQLAVEQGSITSTSSLAESQKLLWTMHTEDLLDLQEIFEISGLAGFDVYSNALDDLRVLTQNALYTFGKMAVPTNVGTHSSGKSSRTGLDSGESSPGRSSKESGAEVTTRSESNSSTGDVTSANTQSNARISESGKSRRQRSSAKTGTEGDSGPNRSTSGSRSRHKGRSKSGSKRGQLSRTALMIALNQVVTRMSSDAVLSLRAGLARLLTDAVEARVQECMVAPCADIATAAQSLVTRDMQLMVHPLCIAEAMVREMVADFVQNLLGKYVIQASNRMQDLADRLVCANPVPIEP